MKNKMIKTLSATLIVLSCLTFFSSFKKNEHSTAATTTYYSSAIITESLHERIMGWYDPNVYGQYANAWFRKYTLTVTIPAGWRFSGTPYIECLRDDQGAFGWNNFAGSPDRFYKLSSTSNSITYVCWAGSRSMMLRLACDATQN